MSYEPDNAQFKVDDLLRLNYLIPTSFISTMIPDELKFDIPNFHKVVLSRMMFGGSHQCYALPRGTAKTTLVQLAVLWHLIYTEHTYCMYVSAIHGNAAQYVEAIIEIMESENFQKIYGVVNFEYKRTSLGDYSFWLDKVTWVDIKDKDGTIIPTVHRTRRKCYIQCKGATQAVRGSKKGSKRPSLLIMDDVEDKELLTTGNSEGNYTKLSNWVESTLLKALDKTLQKVIQIGNLVAAKSVLMDNLMDDRYESMVYGIIKEDGSPLWPDLWPYHEIQADYNTYLKKNKIALWYAEMMNFPRPPGGGIINIGEIMFKEAPLPDASNNRYGVITVDLAATNQSYSHATAVTVHIFDGEHWINADGFSRVGVDPIELLMEIVALTEKWRINFVGLEAVAFQNILKPIYDYLLKTMNIDHIEFVKCPARNAKTERISAYAGLIKERVIAMGSHRHKTLNQLLKYDVLSNTNDDDDIDSAAHIQYMLSKYGHEIAEGYKRAESRFTSAVGESEMAVTNVGYS